MNCTLSSMLRAGLAAAALATSFLSCTAHAQGATRAVHVDVPFAFESGSRQLPAGLYTVSVDSRQIVTVAGNGLQTAVIGIPDETLTPAPATVVVFRRYGDRYFLRAVRVAGRMTSTHTTISKQEREVQIATEQAQKSGVMVALADTTR